MSVRPPQVACGACGAPYTEESHARDCRVMCERCYVEVGPFLAWLRAYVRAHGGSGPAARRLGVTSWALERHLKGLAAYIHVSTADRLFVAAGQPEMLRELYEYWYQVEEEVAA